MVTLPRKAKAAETKKTPQQPFNKDKGGGDEAVATRIPLPRSQVLDEDLKANYTRPFPSQLLLIPQDHRTLPK